MGDQGRCQAGRSRAWLGRHRWQLQPGTGVPPWLHHAGVTTGPAAPHQAGCRPPQSPPLAPAPAWQWGQAAKHLYHL